MNGITLRSLMGMALLLGSLGGVAQATCSPATCVGDCNANGSVVQSELNSVREIAVGDQALATCTAADADGDCAITVSDHAQAVNNTFTGCPGNHPQGGAGLNVTITNPSATVCPGAVVDMVVSFSGGRGAAAEAQLDMTWPSVVTAADCSVHSNVSPPHYGRHQWLTSTTERSLILDDTYPVDIMADGGLLDCEVTVSSTAAAGAYTISGSNSVVVDNKGNVYPSTVHSGTLTVQCKGCGCPCP